MRRPFDIEVAMSARSPVLSSLRAIWAIGRDGRRVRSPSHPQSADIQQLPLLQSGACGHLGWSVSRRGVSYAKCRRRTSGLSFSPSHRHRRVNGS
jgi:hypothetical protein